MSRDAAQVTKASGVAASPRGAVARADDRVVAAALRRRLRRRFGPAARIQIEDRRPSEYRTSFPIHELRVRVDGAALDVLVKDLRRDALTAAARRAKPPFLHDPAREVEVYRRLLAPADLGTAECFGAVAGARSEQRWLFLEKVRGLELYQIGDTFLWQAAAAWLARLHAHFAPRVEALRAEPYLLRHDTRYYRRWLRRAERFVPRRADVSASRRREFTSLVRRYGPVLERLTGLPRTLVHGEFYASNVLLRQEVLDAGAVRGTAQRDASAALALSRWVCPIDWEMAAVGPGLSDLACLVSGGWSAAERSGFLRVYRDSLIALGQAPPPLTEMDRDLDFCRLQTAVQWLGWSPSWSPPREHAHDWLGEALELAAQLRF